MNHRVVESLLAMGGKQNKANSIDLLSVGLIIKCKDTGHRYTISRIDFEEGKPCVICYRHYGPKDSDIVYVKLQEKDFSKYEAA